VSVYCKWEELQKDKTDKKPKVSELSNKRPKAFGEGYTE